MDHTLISQIRPLEAFIAAVQRRYPASSLRLVENSPEQVVIQLDQFTITIQETIEVAAPTNSHRLVEQMALEMKQLLSRVNMHVRRTGRAVKNHQYKEGRHPHGSMDNTNGRTEDTGTPDSGRV